MARTGSKKAFRLRRIDLLVCLREHAGFERVTLFCRAPLQLHETGKNANHCTIDGGMIPMEQNKKTGEHNEQYQTVADRNPNIVRDCCHLSPS